MTLSSPTLVIPLSKRKIVLLTFGAVTFIALGILLYLNADVTRWGSALVDQSVAAVGVVFFGLCAAYGLSKLFDSTPGLVINDQGIFDNSSGISAGLIPWSEITGFKVTTVQKQRFLSIQVRNPEKYIQRASGIKRHLVAMNTKYFGGPIHISSNTLKIRFDDLMKTITEAHAKYR